MPKLTVLLALTFFAPLANAGGIAFSTFLTAGVTSSNPSLSDSGGSSVRQLAAKPGLTASFGFDINAAGTKRTTFLNIYSDAKERTRRGFGIGLEFAYSELGYVRTDLAEVGLKYIVAPVYVQYVKERFTVFGGAYYARRVGSVSIQVNNSDTGPKSWPNRMNWGGTKFEGSDFGFIVGARAQVLGRFFLDARYLKGVKNLYENPGLAAYRASSLQGLMGIYL